MTDPRVERLAELLAGYSLQLREGDVVAFDGSVVASPLLLALYQAALRRGARPFVTARLPGLTELLLEEGSDEQIDCQISSFGRTTRRFRVERSR